MGHIILLLRVLSDGMMIEEAYKRPCQTDQSRVEIKIFRDAGTDTAQHAVGFTAIQFLAIHRKVSFSFIIRCFADFVKLHLDPVYLEEQGRPHICSAGRCGRCRRRSRSGRARSRADRTAFRYRSGCHTVPFSVTGPPFVCACIWHRLRLDSSRDAEMFPVLV